VVRFAVVALTAALAWGGCSAVAAVSSRPREISALRIGAGRRAVERSLGRPKALEACGSGARATYRVRVLDPQGPALPSAAANLGIAGGAATATGLAVARGCRDLAPFDRAAGLVAGAATFVAADLFLAARTVVCAAQHPRRVIVVVYDARGTVRDFTVAER